MKLNTPRLRAFNIPLSSIQTLFHQELTRFSHVCHCQPLEAAITNRALRLMVEDLLNSCMIWSNVSTSQCDQFLHSHWPWYSANLTNEHSVYLEDTVLSKFRNTYLGDYITGIIGRTWNQWSILTNGFDIALVEGEDYRIVEWEAKVASGEWQSEAKLPRKQIRRDDIDLLTQGVFVGRLRTDTPLSRLSKSYPELSCDDIQALLEQGGIDSHGTYL